MPIRFSYTPPTCLVVLLATVSSFFQVCSTSAQSTFTGNLTNYEADYIAERVVVKFKGSVSSTRAQAIARQAGAELISQGYGQAFHLAKVPPGTVPIVAEALSKNPNVEFAHADWIVHLNLVPNDTYYSYQWHLDNSQYGGIEMEEAWARSAGGKPSTVVAVLDTGIAYENYNGYCQAPDLAGTNFVPGYDFINLDTHANDDNSHGTHVAGTIAQTTGNGTGTAGVAYNVSLMPVKVLGANGSGSISAIANGIRFAADNGAHIINMSLGIEINPRRIQALGDAVAYADAKGVLQVAAAGNSGRRSLGYPAGYSEVIAVTATGYDETLASYANTGDGLELSAPGGEDVDLNGDGYPDMVLQQTLNPNTQDVCDFNYWFLSGTSMASPHVAGLAALLISEGADAAQARQIMRDTADDLGANGYDTTYGYGLINADRALAALLSGSDPTTDEPPSISLTEPASGSTLSGNVSIAANASDDNGVDTVEFYVGGDPIGMDLDGSNGWAMTWDSTTVTDGDYSISAIATDTVGQTAMDSINVTVSNGGSEPPAGGAPHIGDLDGNPINEGRTWRASVTITVHDGDHQPLAGADVDYTWSFGTSGSGTVQTGADGTAVVESSSMQKRDNSAILTVTDVRTAAGYDATLNHDPDGDSDGVKITVSK